MRTTFCGHEPAVDYRIERPKSIFVMKSSFRREGDTLTDATVKLGGKKASWITRPEELRP